MHDLPVLVHRNLRALGREWAHELRDDPDHGARLIAEAWPELTVAERITAWESFTRAYQEER